MSGVMPALDRLQAIEAATQEYAEFSRDSFGLAGVVGAALLAGSALLVHVAPPRWDVIASVLGLTAWIVTLWAARQYYQRRGAVVLPPVRGVGRAMNLFVVYTGAVVAILVLFPEGTPDGVDGAHFWASMATVLAIPLLVPLAARGLRGMLDSIIALGLLLVPRMLRGLASMHHDVNAAQRHFLWGSFWFVLGGLCVALVVAGFRQHLAFRRLERRLAALRSVAAAGDQS